VQGTPPSQEEQVEKEEKPQRGGRGQDALSNYCVNLNKKAQQGKIDPLIGRDVEIERTIQILCRRTKNNPLYVGDPASARPPSRRAWPSASSRATCPRCC
jgi:ATP-dependent Clp protease ATP-binding subunit ClpA